MSSWLDLFAVLVNQIQKKTLLTKLKVLWSTLINGIGKIFIIWTSSKQA